MLANDLQEQGTIKIEGNEDIINLAKTNMFTRQRHQYILWHPDKQMYATNDELLYKNVEVKRRQINQDAGYASDMKGKSLFIAINAEAILDLPIVKMMAGFGGRRISNILSNWLQKGFLYPCIREGKVRPRQPFF